MSTTKYRQAHTDALFEEDYVFFNSKEDEREVLQNFYNSTDTAWDTEQSWKFE